MPDPCALSSIVFYFPFRHPSGVSNLFVRMAGWLTEHGTRPVAVIDYPDGQMARSLPAGSPVRLIPFVDGVECAVPDDAVLVMQTALPYTFPSNLRLRASTRLVQWHFLYYALVNTLVPVSAARQFQQQHPSFYRAWMSVLQPGLKASIWDYIKDMNSKGALIFHDRQIVEQTSEYLGVPIEDPVCLPVPVRIPARLTAKDCPAAVLRCGWVGRLYGFKVHILVHTAKRLSAWAKNSGLAVELCVVGDGDEAWRLDELDIEHKLFRLRHVGVVASDELESFMRDSFDLAFSMGTSALESAAIGIPTALLDYSFDPIFGRYRFKWLFDSVPGDIGHKIGPGDLEDDGDSLARLLEETRTDYRGISTRCYEYCKEYHGIDTIGGRLLKVIDSCGYTWADVPSRLRRVSLFRRLRNVVRSIRNRR